MELEEAIKRLNIIKSTICYDSDEENENKEAIKDILAIEVILKELDNYKTDNRIEKIKNYANNMNDSYTETINDYIDDDKIGNKYIIGEFIETREYWRDIIRIINNQDVKYKD